jgi:outer membrane protein OmpA-like peptidoglycan-associated protein
VTQTPTSNAAAPTAQEEPALAAPTVTQVPAANAAAPTTEKEPAVAAPMVMQVPASNAASPTVEKGPATKPDEAASDELASLKPGFSPQDLVAALNDSVINFRSGSAELPASLPSFLQNAAEDLKRIPAGYVLEIAGYTDNTGDAAMNVALSRRRADAVREALVKSGANADMLVAKGYGSADPIASNDTPDGRLRNRRIDYRVLKTPDKH